MPKSSFCRDPDKEIRDILYPETDCMARVSERTGMTEPTLGRRKRNPRDTKISEFRALIKAKNIPPERAIQVLYPGMKFENMKFQIIYGER